MVKMPSDLRLLSDGSDLSLSMQSCMVIAAAPTARVPTSKSPHVHEHPGQDEQIQQAALRSWLILLNL